jgi:hypothetical protein
MFARIGMLRALNQRKVKPAVPRKSNKNFQGHPMNIALTYVNTRFWSQATSNGDYDLCAIVGASDDKLGRAACGSC